MAQQTQMTGWRLDVRTWLQSVVSQDQRSFHRDFGRAANVLKSSFPRNFWIALAGQFVKALAVWLVKAALRDAATDLGFSLNDETLDFLSELAVDSMLAAPA
jgi:hypothetical protein